MDNFWDVAVLKFEEYLDNTNTLVSIHNINNESNKAKQLKFKIKNYKKWVQEVKNFRDQKTKIDNIQDINNLGLKGGLLKKLIEIYNSNEISDNLILLEIIKTNKNPELNTETEEISKLTSVHDIGHSTAKKLYSKGVTLDKLLNEWTTLINNDESYSELNFINGTIQQKVSKEKTKVLSKIYGFNKDKILKKFINTKYLKHLTYYQLVAIKYYEDIKQRIDRSEIDLFKNAIDKLVEMLDPNLIAVICGSYRRECSNSGDIDILLTHTNVKTKEELNNLQYNYLGELVRVLNHLGIICDNLSEGEFKYMGMCRLNTNIFKSPYARRLDIKFVYYNSFVPELLHFTGSGDINKQMRLKAIKMNMFLSETGLYTNKDKEEEIICYEEKEIFKKLKIKYLKPKDRHIDNYIDL